MMPTIVARLFGWLRRKAPAVPATGRVQPLPMPPAPPRAPTCPRTPAPRVARAPYNRFSGHSTPPPAAMPSTFAATDPMEQWWLGETERICAEGYARMSPKLLSGNGGDFAGGGASGSWEESRPSTCSADTADHSSSDSCSASDTTSSSSAE